MVDELAVLWENFLPSERTPSVERRIAQLVSALEASASSKPPKRKRKKRRKKRLPRSPRPLLRDRAHCRLRQWLVPGWSFCAALGQGWHARCGTTTGAWFDGSENCGAPAVPVHRRSSTSSSFRRGSFSWSRLFSRPQRFLSCRSFSCGRCSCCAGRAVPQVVLLRVQRNAWFHLGYTFLCQFTEIFTFFYVKTWISDPEVDSRLSGVSANAGLWTLLGDDFRNGFRISSVRQWIHIRRQSSGAFVRISYFLREGPEVDLVPARFAHRNLDIILMSSFTTSDGGFCRILRHFSHSVRMDVSAHFSALDDEEFFVVEGSGWWGRRESDSQVFCHSN